MSHNNDITMIIIGYDHGTLALVTIKSSYSPDGASVVYCGFLNS